MRGKRRTTGQCEEFPGCVRGFLLLRLARQQLSTAVSAPMPWKLHYNIISRSSEFYHESSVLLPCKAINQHAEAVQRILIRLDAIINWRSCWEEKGEVGGIETKLTRSLCKHSWQMAHKHSLEPHSLALFRPYPELPTPYTHSLEG